jgi:hypothetical protein
VVGFGEAIRAILASAVGSVERGREAGDLFTLLGIGGSSENQADLQQLHLASHIFGQLELVEAGGFFGELDAFVDVALVGKGGDGFSVAGDEVFVDPIGLLVLDAEFQESAFGVGQEIARVVYGGLRLAIASGQ